MYCPNSIAPPAGKTILKVALPSQPPVREEQSMHVLYDAHTLICHVMLIHKVVLNKSYITEQSGVPPGSALIVPLI